ncbi:unnamed protein product [Microthlaspi erraticum]|uniref:Uncharacterized protein n=1 Tax=Microthlaspi erraticum TaxID=1685480 RepID=A0A6D2I9D8_9BRAS|nr:unnamed protein product [Microthlaspi erraticum]
MASSKVLSAIEKATRNAIKTLTFGFATSVLMKLEFPKVRVLIAFLVAFSMADKTLELAMKIKRYYKLVEFLFKKIQRCILK